MAEPVAKIARGKDNKRCGKGQDGHVSRVLFSKQGFERRSFL